MAKVILFVALFVQASLIYGTEIEDNDIDTSRAVLNERPDVDEMINDFQQKEDWTDLFFMPLPSNFHPSSSAALMASVTNSDKNPDDQLEDIKEMASKITLAIQSEIANLLAFALTSFEKEAEPDNKTEERKKRESPLDSSALIMRLLKHIKSNNENQNIAIEKMMSAQEIADKFGIDFTPDPEILSDLAQAANEQASDMTSILNDALELANVTAKAIEVNEQVDFVPVEKETNENNSYYAYSVQQPEQDNFFIQHPSPPQDYVEHIHYEKPEMKYGHHEHYYNQVPPHHHVPPVSPKPTYYDTFMPAEFQYCPMEPVTTTIVIPVEEFIEQEPELMGEEYEETITSKMFVNRDEEPGTATVNHVMTYTISEKAHFRKPEIESLPQQMQYTFFLM